MELKKVQKIYNTRLKMLETLVDGDRFNISVFSRYFGISPATVRTMFRQLYEGKADNYESTNPISYDSLVSKREEILKNSTNRKSTLEKLGYWCEPYDIYFQIDNATDRHLATKYVFATKDNGNLKEFAEKENLNSITEYLIKNREDALYDIFSEITANTENTSLLKEVTSIPPDKHKEVRDFIRKCYSEQSQDKSVITPNTYKKTERMEKIWELYTAYGSTHGFTQQQIADKLNITRATVISDIKKYKKMHPEVIDPTQLYRQRHAGKEYAELRKRWVPKIIDLYKKGVSINMLSKCVPFSSSTISQILQENGLNISPSDIKNAKNLKIGFEKRGQFSEKTKNENDQEYVHMGSTPHILDSVHAPRASEDTKARNALRHPILKSQRTNMAILRNDAELEEKWEKYNGNISVAKRILTIEKKKNAEASIDEKDVEI